MKKPIEGVTRCDCGVKYWDEFFVGGLPVCETTRRAVREPKVWRCHGCGWIWRPTRTVD